MSFCRSGSDDTARSFLPAVRTAPEASAPAPDPVLADTLPANSLPERDISQKLAAATTIFPDTVIPTNFEIPTKLRLLTPGLGGTMVGGTQTVRPTTVPPTRLN